MKKIAIALCALTVIAGAAVATAAAATPLHERLVRFETSHDLGTTNYRVCTIVDLPSPSDNDVAGGYWSPATWPVYGLQEQCYTIDASNLFGNARHD